MAEVADILQIPAFLCRQTDLILAAARTGKVLHIKKGQMCGPSVMRNSADKARSAGEQPAWDAVNLGATASHGQHVHTQPNPESC